ncbi:Uncharacterised protein [Mycobacteroides abscessus subsp. abscessus]|nr:Uncharacterised protein [Mycobacteroides abscessus subsp. abscessus]
MFAQLMQAHVRESTHRIADRDLQQLVRRDRIGHTEAFAHIHGKARVGTAQRDLLEEQREHEPDGGDRCCAQEHQVQGIGICVDDGYRRVMR